VKLTAKQVEANALLQTVAKHILLDGGSRSGKSALIVRAICSRAIKAPASRHAILRFRFNHCKESIGMDTLPAVMAKCFPGVPYTLNRSDWYAQLPNKSEIWLGGLDDKERTEKILGKEYASMYLNEASQIPYNSRNLAVTRLAQRSHFEIDGEQRELALKMYYDCNPPAKSHWIYQMFYQHRDPETKQPISSPHNYVHMTMNPRDNAENLPADYIKELENLPARTRRRFLDGQYGEAAPGALWTEEVIDMWRETSLPDMVRVVVAVDPSGAADEDNAHNDAIGIVVAGLGTDGNGYLLEDCTIKAGPKTWGQVSVSAFERHMADKIVGETNYGGEMVKFVVQTARRDVPFSKITASRGKVVRAEPVSALTEKGKIRFAGRFPLLEEELCGFTTHGYVGTDSPNRADAFVFAMSELFPGMVKEEKKPKAESAYQRRAFSHGGGWMR
jgi:hypothetical protein